MALTLAIDQSTSATKALLFDEEGRCLDAASRPHRQIYPQPGWVEHDPQEIWANVLDACREVLGRRGVGCHDLLCVSLTNQRETIVAFDRRTGRPLHNAIVWQDRRGDPFCRSLIDAGREPEVRHLTGLKIDGYFSGSKVRWLLDAQPEIRRAMEAGEAVVGTIDAWLVHRLTEGRVFATDPSNASRTLLYDINAMEWSEALCGLFSVPMTALPAVRDSSAVFGETTLGGAVSAPAPICGVLGDQQAALFGERCYEPGSAKVTFGTGSFVLMNLGSEPRMSESGIVTTVGWRMAGATTYALEGVVFSTGATVAWLRDQLGILADAAESEALASQVADNGGVYLVPAFTGLSAPYWSQSARAAILGLTQHSDRRHVARAALESIAYQVRDVLDAMRADSGTALRVVRGDGGAVRNALLMQLTADITGVPVQASAEPELTALGAAMAGMLGMDACKSLDELAALPQAAITYEPRMSRAEADRLYAGWQEAVQRVL